MKIEDFKDILKEKKLFSPGPTPIKEIIKIDFSHRSKEFEKLYKETKQKLRKKFKISKEYEIVFIQGSGTAAIETVLSSLDKRLYPIFIVDGIFGKRAKNIAFEYNYATKEQNIGNYLYYVQFETSKSEYNNYDNLYKNHNLVIVDCVSSFGFYPIPKADIIIISSSKILGGLPVMGIILYNKKAEKWFKDKGDYLNLVKYIKYNKRNQTPHTSLISQISSFNRVVTKVISKEEIISNCKALQTNKVSFIGEKIAPVLTIQTNKLTKLLKIFKKYNIEVYYNPAYMDKYFQISMFNYKDTHYYKLIKFILEKYG